MMGAALLLGVAQGLALGTASHRRRIGPNRVRRRTKPHVARQLRRLEGYLNGKRWLLLSVLQSGDSGNTIASRLRISFHEL